GNQSFVLHTPSHHRVITAIPSSNPAPFTRTETLVPAGGPPAGGAVYLAWFAPIGSIFPSAGASSDHVSGGSVAPPDTFWALAVNIWVAPAATLTVDGDSTRVGRATPAGSLNCMPLLTRYELPLIPNSASTLPGTSGNLKSLATTRNRHKAM